MPLDKAVCPSFWADLPIVLVQNVPSSYGVWEQTKDVLHFVFSPSIPSRSLFYFHIVSTCKQIAITVPENLDLTLIEPAHPSHWQYRLGRYARLKHFCLTKNGDTHFILEASAQLNHWSNGLHAEDSVMHTSIQMRGDHSQVDWREAHVCKQKKRVATDIQIEHTGRRTQSNCCIRSIVTDVARFQCEENVTVHASALNAIVEQNNFNYLLSPKAQVKSSPQLHIHTKHVAATHGFATQPIDQEALFYLQSHGLSPTEAQSLLLKGFLRESYLHLRQDITYLDDFLERTLEV